MGHIKIRIFAIKFSPAETDKGEIFFQQISDARILVACLADNQTIRQTGFYDPFNRGQHLFPGKTRDDAQCHPTPLQLTDDALAKIHVAHRRESTLGIWRKNESDCVGLPGSQVETPLIREIS